MLTDGFFGKVAYTTYTMVNKDHNETAAPHLQASTDVVYNRLGDQGVLVHMRTNQIYELNWTGARFWELISAGHNREEIQQIMLQEFDVDEADLTAEIDTTLASLKNEGLVTSYDQG